MAPCIRAQQSDQQREIAIGKTKLANYRLGLFGPGLLFFFTSS
jgi:hypothetical protein